MRELTLETKAALRSPDSRSSGYVTDASTDGVIDGKGIVAWKGSLSAYTLYPL